MTDSMRKMFENEIKLCVNKIIGKHNYCDRRKNNILSLKWYNCKKILKILGVKLNRRKLSNKYDKFLIEHECKDAIIKRIPKLGKYIDSVYIGYSRWDYISSFRIRIKIEE